MRTFLYFRHSFQMENQQEHGKRIRTYKCHYCDAKEGTIYIIVQPCKQKHPENALKYYQIVMDEKTAH